MNRKAVWSVVAAISIACTSACSGGGTTVTLPVEAITVTSGSGQSAVINAAFAAPLVATVSTGGVPNSGVSVTFSAPTTTGASGTFAGGVSTAMVTTGSNGIATSPTFTANGTTGGPYTVTATAAGVTAPANFSLTNTAVPVETITVTSGSGQSAVINTAFAAHLVATVSTGGVGNIGVSVTFAAPASGASGTFAGGALTAMVTTGSNGVATSPVFTANGTTGGPYTVTATAAGVTTPADFSLTNTAVVPVEIITATSGSGQSAVINTAFAAHLVATVSTGGVPNSGVSVTFTAPSTGVSGTFAGGAKTAMVTTGSNGIATSPVFTANGTTGGPYTVTATAAGATTPADFSLTNTSMVVTSSKFSFYLSGQEAGIVNSNGFYALAGSVTIESNGIVAGGEQDFNDADGFTFTDDAITGGSLTVNGTSGQGTLTLVTNDVNVGVNGTETLGVQFVNGSHALLIEFEANQTSSGSLDLQTLPSPLAPPSGSFAFTLNGIALEGGIFDPVVSGGVFTTSGGTISAGIFDLDDNGTVTLGTGIMAGGIVSVPDAFGRGTITATSAGAPLPVTIVYYIVGPEAIRLIDVDTTDTGIGSAYGQGTPVSFNNASLGSSVFIVQSSVNSIFFAAAGQFTTTTNNFSGVADVDENGSINNGNGASTAVSISGTYLINTNGYGLLTIGATQLEDVTSLGIYMVDPNININDPNNITDGLGGALLADLDTTQNGTGVVIPQTDTTTGAFSGKYAFGASQFVECLSICEVDFLGQGTVTGGVLSGTGLLNDPTFALALTSSGEYNDATYNGTAVPDSSNPGRYTMLGSDSLAVQFGGGTVTGDLSVVIYQASGGQLLWMEEDETGTLVALFGGSLQQQGSLAGMPAVRKAATSTQFNIDPKAKN